MYFAYFLSKQRQKMALKWDAQTNVFKDYGYIMFASFFGFIIAYCLGSLSSAVIVSKILHLPDPRENGSGNPGATNVLRTGNKKAAAFVLIADLLKGLLAIWIARFLGASGFGLSLVALAAVVGHIFPIFFGFKGGKGVATALGAMMGLNIGGAVIGIMTWIICVFVTRYVSLASLVATAIVALFTFASNTAYFIPVLSIAALIFWRHASNIERLKKGEENKLNF